uniref:Uncharacterized protein n=1 Tax=Aegilops tauschii subsp. strangulata TaxID=200361 RepID=A0A453BFU4_AEGTS
PHTPYSVASKKKSRLEAQRERPHRIHPLRIRGAERTQCIQSVPIQGAADRPRRIHPARIHPLRESPSGCSSLETATVGLKEVITLQFLSNHS